MYRGGHASRAVIQRSSSSQFATKQGAMSALVQERPRFLNVGQAAEYIGVSAASLRKWSNDGFVPVYRTPGGQRRFAQHDLDAFMQAMRQSAA
jgi:excisionase family DNA binding protein